MGKKQNRVPSLRIGGKDEAGRQLVACSLELVAEPIAPRAEAIAWVDWDRLPAALGFNRRETAVWFHCLKNGNQNARQLGLSPQEHGSAVREIMRKLKSQVARPFLGWLSHEEILIERTSRKRSSLGTSFEGQRMTFTELKQQHATAKANFDRISDRTHKARLAVEETERSLRLVETEAKADAAKAVLEDRESPSAQIRKRIMDLKVKLIAFQDEYDATRDALIKAGELVTATESEITARRHEQLKAAIVSPRSEYLRALANLVTKANALDLAIVQNGGVDLSTLFPPSDPTDSFADFPDRGATLAHFMSTVRLGRARMEYEGEASIPYHLRKVG